MRSIGCGLLDDRREVHVREDVALDVDAGRHLGQLQAALGQPEDAALGDVEHRLPGLAGRSAPLKVTWSTCLTNFRARPSWRMRSWPSSTAIFSPPAVKVPAKTTLRAFWLMLMKPPAPASFGPKRLTLRLPSLVAFGQAEAGHVEAAAVVEVELLVLVDDRLGVDAGAEVEARLRHAADHARLGGQRHVLQHPLLVGDRGQAFRHADAEVDHAARRQLEDAAPGDQLALVERQRRQRTERHADLRGEGRDRRRCRRSASGTRAWRRRRSRRGCRGSSPASG